jgi:hypothetical protein
MKHSTDPYTITQLHQWKQQLSAFRTVACQLMHEEVLEISGEGITADESTDQLQVRRKGFCKKDLRVKALGCAHSRSNDLFGSVADAVYDAGVLDIPVRPSVSVNDLVLKIYLMDHEKGRAEKKYAVAQKNHDSNEMAIVRDLLNTIGLRHTEILNQLEQLRQTIISQLDNAIGQFAIGTV